MSWGEAAPTHEGPGRRTRGLGLPQVPQPEAYSADTCATLGSVNAGHQSRPSITGHIVLLPSASPHRALRLVTDVDLLLAATIAAVRMNCHRRP
jgi:hypothetical protein